MPRLLYTLLYYCLTPLLFLRLLIKHQKSSAYKEQRQSLRLAERFALFAASEFKDDSLLPVWLHTVSVGEFLATLPLLRQLMQDYPEHPLIITCTTTTGSAQISKTFAEEIKAGSIFHVYLPYDLPGSMQRFFKKMKPCLGIVMETEIWPNMLYIAQQCNVPMLLLNARMSERSAKGYARFPSLTKTALNQFSSIAVQNEVDASRLINLGADKKLLHITGSIKFDIKINPQDIKDGALLREQLNWQEKTVLIAASTHKNEDEILLDVFKNLKRRHSDLVMLLVPRHPERFQSVYQLLTQSVFKVLKRSQMNAHTESPIDILLGDSMGEMMRYFACSDVVFMGGTMVPTGGHNILEPAALGLPIVCGPHMFNFAVINELFLQHQAIQQVTDVVSLENALDTILADKQTGKMMGEVAQKLMSQNSGAVNNMMTLIKVCLKQPEQH